MLASFALVFIFLFSILVPFFRENNLLGYDMSGMYFSSWYTSKYLFPAPIGWNPYFYFGFAQNQFYGPLYPYLVSILALAMPIDLAFRVMLALVLLATPISFYYFARSFGFTRNNSSAIMLLMFCILLIFPWDFFGGTIHSTFGVGLLANALALPLFFFYLGSLKKNYLKGKILPPGILLSLIALAHSLSALAALFAMLAFFISRPDKKTLLFTLGHFALAFLLSAFYIVPALAKIEYASVYQIGSLANNLLLLAGAIILLVAVKLLKRENILPLSAFLLLILSFSYVGEEILHLPVHFYRFTAFIYLIVPILIFEFFRTKTNISWGVAFALSALCLLSVSDLHPEGYSKLQSFPEINIPKNERLLVEAAPDKEPTPHEFQYGIPMKNEIYTATGVFAESAKNARYVFDIQNEMDPSNISWGIITDTDRASGLWSENYKYLPGQLGLFGINYVATASAPVEQWELLEENIFAGLPYAGQYNLSLYKAGNHSLVEALNSIPEYAGENWDEKVTDWFLSEEVNTKILVNENVPEFVAKGTETVEILEQSMRQDYLRFKVNSDVIVPVLVKISQFPNWHAYSGGKELHIYRASPYLMLVYARGEIEFRYEQTPGDTFGWVLSFAGVVIVVCLIGKKI